MYQSFLITNKNFTIENHEMIFFVFILRSRILFDILIIYFIAFYDNWMLMSIKTTFKKMDKKIIQ